MVHIQSFFSSASLKKILLVGSAAIFLLLLISSPGISVTEPGSPEFMRIPPEYGEVIYQYNQKSSNQLFIIGTSHRDSLTRMNGRDTPRVQAEVYKIGEWLIQNRGLKLLLPEGFFRTGREKIEKETGISAGKEIKGQESLDLKVLEKKLGDNKTFVNAEMLLKENYPLYLKQIEDRNLYFAVSQGIQKLVNCRNNPGNYLLVKSELDYLQDRRTAALLQKIPEAVQDEFSQGNIGDRKAFLTIGMNHIYNIIKYLSENRIAICSPPFASIQCEDYTAELNLVKENFGVCIILPRTLVKDQQVLKINGLDNIVVDYRNQFSTGSSVPSP